MLNYTDLSEKIKLKIERDIKENTLPQFSFDEKNAVRRDNTRDCATVLRTPFIRDIDKIMHSPYYNRYTDKTQVFSFYKTIKLNKCNRK